MDPEDLEWFYVDRSGSEFGPFGTGKMRAWFAHGFFPIGRELLVRLREWTQHVPVRALYPEPDGAFAGAPRQLPRGDSGYQQQPPGGPPPQGGPQREPPPQAPFDDPPGNMVATLATGRAAGAAA
eukprot:CAMPEP_0179272540 /NCGR_PEP_ID=MMETSP0797-20121207/32554_1 /TAXON_ID=47934 /ORGANISM="Dinophysis acuminata, Strain DAEP01" /LENGTH=124 /DNA_ID=CAMNT_0020980947 /DNA_START=45 /DNA_END=416 /DNA_ORIENTATION=-